MKKRNFVKMLSLTLAVSFGFTSIVWADDFNYSLDASKNSIEQIEYQTSGTEDFSNKTNVYAEVGALYKVTIPKVIVLSGVDKKANYFVTVEGDIAGNEVVQVKPDETVDLYSNNKTVQTGVITQNKITWTVSELGKTANGLVVADGITAGKWSGTFNFNINLSGVLGDINVPSLMLSTSNFLMGVGDAHQVNAYYAGEDVTQQVDWTSDNNKFSVTDGLVETSYNAQVGDSATITATLNDDSPLVGLLDKTGIVAIVSAEDGTKTASFTVTIVDIVFDEEGSVIEDVEIKPGENRKIRAKIEPDVNGVVLWSCTAPAGMTLIKSGNDVTIKISNDMPEGKTYYIIATYGDYSKIIPIRTFCKHIAADPVREKEVAAKCLVDGTYDEAVYCAKCGTELSREAKTDVNSKLGHNYVEGECTRCDAKLPLLEYTAEGYEGVYDGANHSIKVTSEGNTIEYSTDNVTFSSTNPEFKDVGTYTVYYKISKPTYKTLTGSKKVIINKTNSTYTKAPSYKKCYYNGKEMQLLNSGTTSDGTIKYKLGENGTYSTAIPTATEVGTYKVFYKIFGDDNHYDSAEQSIDARIAEGYYVSWSAPLAKTYCGYHTKQNNSSFNSPKACTYIGNIANRTIAQDARDYSWDTTFAGASGVAGNKRIVYQKPNGEWAAVNPFAANTSGITIRAGSKIYLQMYAGDYNYAASGVIWRYNGANVVSCAQTTRNFISSGFAPTSDGVLSLFNDYRHYEYYNYRWDVDYIDVN